MPIITTLFMLLLWSCSNNNTPKEAEFNVSDLYNFWVITQVPTETAKTLPPGIMLHGIT